MSESESESEYESDHEYDDFDSKVINIQSNNIDAAAGEIIGVLEDTGKPNYIFFGGWHGFGASATLKVVAQRLKSSKSKFDKVIHVDCSVWKSMRALQKSVAEELKLPFSVMAIFDQHDEHDDFNGKDQSSRRVIANIREVIFRTLASCRFLVIFHNGSGKSIDLYKVGIPVTTFLSNKVLWTCFGRFAFLGINPFKREYVRLPTSLKPGSEEFLDIVCEEAKEIAMSTGILEPDYMNQKIINQCFKYELELRSVMSGLYFGVHAPSRWICDGIIQSQRDISAWEIGDSLHRNMHLNCLDAKIIKGEKLRDRMIRVTELFVDPFPRWCFLTHKGLEDGTDVLHTETTSLFLFADRLPVKKILVLPVSMFLHSGSNQLRVLDLSWCTFSFASPPFLCCSQLRLLRLDHCTNITDEEYQRKSDHIECGFGTRMCGYRAYLDRPYLEMDGSDEASPYGLGPLYGPDSSMLSIREMDGPDKTGTRTYVYKDFISCFQKLWVLDLSYTDWYWLLSKEMMSLMADLRELNVEGVMNWSMNDLCGGGTSLVKLRVIVDSAADYDMKYNQAPFPNLSIASHLKSIILDRCVGLEHVFPDALPPAIESFSFFNDDAPTAKISSISFRGCSQLKSMLLRGFLERLEELDLSGTLVKTLDLSEVKAPNLNSVILLGCQKLCAILWPPEGRIRKNLKLRIDTTKDLCSCYVRAYWKEKTKEACAAIGSSSICVHAATKQSINRHIRVTDARLLRSVARLLRSVVTDARLPKLYAADDLEDLIEVGYTGPYVYMEIESSPVSGLQQPDQYLYSRDAVFQGHLQDVLAKKVVISWMWDCPSYPTLSAEDWYIQIQDENEMKSRLLQYQQTSIEGIGTSVALLPPSFICDYTKMLHVHDSLSITSIPFPQGSTWKSLEWCRVEKCPKLQYFFVCPPKMEYDVIFYGLQTIWASHLPVLRYMWNWSAISQPARSSFRNLMFLHVDYCPRLIHVLPVSYDMAFLSNLETLEIRCCGDLREVFPLDPKLQEEQRTILLSSLRYIYLHELPTLQGICGSRISTPNLKSIKIRGCWSLKRLPAIPGSNKPLKVDCEKEWWDSLEWDGMEASHHPSLYEPSHSMYYKKAQLPRGTLLR